MLNRGVNGEETDDMLARFAADVIAAHPQLVLWQVGTNSVLRDRPLDAACGAAARRHRGAQGVGADVVLIDLQFAPAVIAKPETPGMVEQIALAAKEENVDLFRRFAIMRDWHEIQHLPFDTFVSPDQSAHERLGLCLRGAKLLGRRSPKRDAPITSAVGACRVHAGAIRSR